jgi:predicted nucleotidyltransferase
MHKRMEITKKVIKEELTLLKNIELAAFVGNVWRENNLRDIDLLVIVGEKNNLVKALKSLTASFNKTKKKVAEKNVVLGCYSTYKLKNIDYFLANIKNKEERYLQLHLLVYPSFDTLQRWEPLEMVESFYETSVVIIGNRDSIVKEISEEMLIQDALYRLNYVVRIYCIEEIRNKLKSTNLNELNYWEKIYQIGNKINNVVVSDLAEKIHTLNSKKTISLKDIIQNMEIVLDILEKRRKELW